MLVLRHPRSHNYIYSIALLGLLLFLCQARAAAPVMTIEALGKGIVELNGPWQFHLGDDPAWAAPGTVDTTGTNGWEQIGADDTWGAQTHPGYTGFAWYRKHIRYTLAPGVTDEIALLDGGVESASEVYWNGKLVGHNGKMPPWPRWDTVQRAHLVHIGPQGEGVLAFRVWLAPKDSSDSATAGGGFENPPVLGNVGHLKEIMTRQEFTDFRLHFASQFVGSLYGLIGLFCLVGWLRDRKHNVLFWLAIFALGPFMDLVFDPNRGSFASAHIRQCIGWGINAAEWFFLIALLRLGDRRWVTRITKALAISLVIFAVLDAGLLLFDLGSPAGAGRYARLNPVLAESESAIEYIWPFVIIYLALKNRVGFARWLIAIAAVLLPLSELCTEILLIAARYFGWWGHGRMLSPEIEILNIPVFPEHFLELALAFAFMFAYYRATKESSKEHQRWGEELKSVQELQQILIPTSIPKLAGYHLTSAYRPAREVGGDFFQIWLSEDEDPVLVVIGDVSGKGLRAAMAVSLIVGMLQIIADSTRDPAGLLAQLNGRLYGRLHGGFATCVALALRPDGACMVATAGHPSPFLNGTEVQLAGSLPLGIMPEVSYENTGFQMEVSDQLFLYTDGLLEARAKNGDLFGFDRLKALSRSRPDAAAAADEAVRFGQDDDITVMTLELATERQVSVSTLAWSTGSGVCPNSEWNSSSPLP